MKRLSTLLERWRAWVEARADADLAVIEVFGERFRVRQRRKADREFHVHDIVHLEAYKMDQITVDLVCLDIWIKKIDAVETCTVHEDSPGWDELVGLLSRELGFDRGAIGRIWNPPFEETRTVIFDRSARR